ncbi:beta-glucosidase BoGH3B isoform X3 [Pyrus x bretschneideri]|uniref:beta-glucosidase BoGH3B isoform X3 n=2 Tax=Pyrus x bretschneideri TaxID=225117 RepID=UPI00202EA554|nr:beta-glucosidase BoGH3B isoform X3 [Pyrus x bretschneideri]
MRYDSVVRSIVDVVFCHLPSFFSIKFHLLPRIAFQIPSPNPTSLSLSSTKQQSSLPTSLSLSSTDQQSSLPIGVSGLHCFSKMAGTPIFLMGLLLSCFCIAIAEAEHIRYKDPKQPLNTRIKDLLSRMTLEEKIGQMVQIERSVASSEVMKKYFIGSILSGGGSVPAQKASPEAWINMVNDFQNGSLSTRLGIPMIYGIDAVHGHNNVYKATIFPHNIGLGATRDPVLVKRIGAATALEARATGIPYVFAPCIAVCRDPRWGRCYESYSEDHKIVQAMTEIIPGLQGELPANSRKGIPFVGGNKKVAACAKHYVGDGGTTRGINENNTVINRHGLLSIHMPGYYDSIIKGVATIMVSYSSWNGVKMHANHDLVTGFLKNTLHFRGFVISDWEGIDRITSPPHANYSYSIQAGINAGIDMVMVPYNYTEFIDGLSSLVKNGIIPMSRIDDAVKRILRVKFVMGLFEEPLADRSLVDQLGSKEHRELAREAVRRSLVLLKNGKSADEPLLPLPKKASKILVAGSHADNLGYQCGGWTIEWQGLSGNNLTEGTTILSAIKNTVDPKTKVVYKENPDADFVKSNDFSYAIVVVGEHPYAETFGDSLNLTIPDPGPSTITNVCGSVKCVVIVISGRPVVIQPYVPLMDALVAAWLPGTEGQGVADVLFGDYGFTGKLSRTWFKTVDQLPMNVGDAHYDPLFPFGYGLTTTPANSN